MLARRQAAFAFLSCPGHLLLSCMLLVPLQAAAAQPSPNETPAAWPQWGGPNRDFTCEATGLADRWPEDGPKQLWSREIGDGFSAIVAADGVLYTMCRREDDDAVLAIDAATGETLWETKYAAPVPQGMLTDFGTGGRSTPLIAGDRLFTIGATVKLNCLDRKTGKVLWSHDLMAEMDATAMGRGYGASPLAYEDLVIIPVGGDGQGVVAFKQDTGEVAWKSPTFPPSYSSPQIVRLGDRDQVLVLQGKEAAGLDPRTGELIWQCSAEDLGGAVMSTPHFGSDDILFCSSARAYKGGTGAFRITPRDGEYKTEKLWFTRKMGVHHANVIRIGDHVYGSSGDFGPAFLMCVDVRTGDLTWRERGFTKSTLLYADGKLLILEENGMLHLAKASPEGLEVVSKVQLLEDKAWTVPTLVGTRLYLRDRKTVMAIDIGATANDDA